MSFLGAAPPVRRRLRELLGAGPPLIAPGVYDALGARLAGQAGFEAIYLTGFGTAATFLGRPDIGLVTQTEMTDQARRITGATDVPVIADADTGYGNALNVIRTVRDYEQAGVAAIQLEDQVQPKRCGHMAGKAVIDVDEAVAKIAAAVAARQDPDLVIVARTDAASVHGIDAAVERARRFADVGADVLFVEAPTTAADIDKIATELAGHTLLFNWVEGGVSPDVTVGDLAEMGFRLVIFPVSVLLAVTASTQAVLRTLRSTSSTDGHRASMTTFADFVDTIGLAEIRAVEDRFGS